MNEPTIQLRAEAVRIDHLPAVDASLLFAHVLSTPVICPCNVAWVVLLNKPLALEYELGLQGQEHSSLLLSAMLADCKGNHPFFFYETDGISVWPIMQS